MVVFTGSGIGVPDYKSKEFLTYIQKGFLEEIKLIDPNAIFTLDFFRRRPEAFVRFAKAFLISDASGHRAYIHPNLTHYLAKMLNDRNMLKSYFTMNIDNLEEDFLPAEKVTHVYGAVNLSKEVVVDNSARQIAPQCSKCGKFESVERFC